MPDSQPFGICADLGYRAAGNYHKFFDLRFPDGCSVAVPGGFVTNAFAHGTVHEAGEDLQASVRAEPGVLTLWEGLTPLGRNEFICWVDDAKQPATRQRRIRRTCEDVLAGKKRPCCWAGCIHRTDKAPGRWQQAVLIDKSTAAIRPTTKKVE